MLLRVGSSAQKTIKFRRTNRIMVILEADIKSGKARVNGNLSVNGTTPMLSQLGFSVGTEQVNIKYFIKLLKII